jgi:hypothetical protein
MAGASRRRYTLSYHYFSQRDARNHLELFLDVGEDLPLETWRCFRGEPLKQARRRFAAAPAHRRVYLGFAGNVSGDRGKLRILRKGFFVDRRTRMSEVFAAHEVHLGENRRRRSSEVRAAHEVHPGANRNKSPRLTRFW